MFSKASGFGAVVDLGSLNGSNGFAIDGLDGNDQLGKSVSNAGDVNGDGYGDILIGAPGTDHNGSYSGSVYVVFGKSTGFSATLDLANLASNAGFRIDGSAAGRTAAGTGQRPGQHLCAGDRCPIGATHRFAPPACGGV